MASVASRILLQTAKANVLDANLHHVCLSRVLIDIGSQRSYISENVRNKLNLKTIRAQKLVIKTFGNDHNSVVKTLDVVQVKIGHSNANDDCTLIEAYCVQFICSPLKNQCINKAKGLEQFKTLKLADSNLEGTDLPIGILIGADHYHKFFTGRTVQSEVGTVASETVIGWVLSGPVPNSPPSNSLDTTNMRCCVEEPRDSHHILRQELNNFWNVESIGSSDCVVNQFEHDIVMERGMCQNSLLNLITTTYL